MKPFRTGLALPLTVAFFYTLCTMLAVLFPDLFMGFMRALLHGLGFDRLTTGEPGLSRPAPSFPGSTGYSINSMPMAW